MLSSDPPVGHNVRKPARGTGNSTGTTCSVVVLSDRKMKSAAAVAVAATVAVAVAASVAAVVRLVDCGVKSRRQNETAIAADEHAVP